MAMSGNTLGTDIYSALVTAGLAIDDATAIDVWKTISTAMVKHIRDEAVITIPALTVSQGTSPAVAPNVAPITTLTIE